MQGVIIKNISDLYTVKYDNKIINCKALGIFRNKNITPIVGDNVIIDINKKVITKILDRTNSLTRPLVSNVDQALIVISAKMPLFSTLLLDKFISIIEFNKIKPIICITKIDLVNDNSDIYEYINYYKKIGYIIVLNTELDKIKELLKNKITVITGQTGVGKSTLLNKLDNNLNLKTNEISHALNRGKHTTRHTELIELFDGLVADTPGFSSLEFNNMNKIDIKNSFIELRKYEGSCKYRDCMHIKEQECYIKELVDKNIIAKFRYENYKKFINEILDRKN